MYLTECVGVCVWEGIRRFLPSASQWFSGRGVRVGLRACLCGYRSVVVAG